MAPQEVIRREAESNEVEVILIQEAVGLAIKETKASIFTLSEDAKGIKTAHPQIGYKEMLDSILNADTVITW